ncbi:hypothetical protein BN2476_300098 [Paraburkholderia piptadeniae]|uniref:Uncharacterized protein n=1 Tax=Paraburkholderia piptadeniae TaxID=1701573 RepID=A0A1N7S2M4_9BURK|nr:hypothetical protein BN2476_300098 [Paraburkholderia piptadeniae]
MSNPKQECGFEETLIHEFQWVDVHIVRRAGPELRQPFLNGHIKLGLLTVFP